MSCKRLILSIFLPALILSTPGISLAEVEITDIPSPEKIQGFIPQSLIDLFNNFNNINIDFSKFSFFNRAVKAIPKSGEEVANGFQWLTNGLGNVDEWLKTHIGLSIVLVVKKVGEFFIWIFQGIANLLTIGLSFINN